MSHALPSLEQLQAIAQRRVDGRCLVPVFKRLFNDVLTPVLAYRRLVRPDARMAPSFLYESVHGGDQIGRFSFLGARPIAELVAYGHDLRYTDHLDSDQSYEQTCDDPLATMQQLSERVAIEPLESLPTFTGGWVGFAGYDTVRYLEPEKLADGPTDDRGLPDLHMQLYRDIVVFDHVHKTMLAITHVELNDNTDDTALASQYAQAMARLDATVDLLVTAAPQEKDERFTGHVDLATPPASLGESNLGDGGYQQAVEVCKQYIAAGDAFQIVPSQRFEVKTSTDPFDIYRALRVINPSPYMAYLQVEGCILVASSPEILCKVEDGVVTNPVLTESLMSFGLVKVWD